jgi:separase
LSATLQERTKTNQLVANAYLLYSILALGRGFPQLALLHAKEGVKLLRRTWNIIEERLNLQTSTCSHRQTDSEKFAEDFSQLNLSTTAITNTENYQPFVGPEFWALITPLFRSLSHLAGLYAHHGMFQETMYFAEQAHKLAKKLGSEAHTAIASAYLGSMWLKAGALDKGAEFLMEAKNLGSSKENNRDTALLAYHLGNMQGLLGDRKAELAAYDEVETTLKNLTSQGFINAADQIVDQVEALEENMSQLTVSKKKPLARSSVTRPKAIAKRKAVTRVKLTSIEVTSAVVEECPQLMSLKAAVLRQKARALMCTKAFADALSLLHEAEGYSSSQTDAVNHGLAMAKRLLLQSMEQMNADPLYSVLQESTISFPSVVGNFKPDKSSGERSSFTRLSPSGKSKVGKHGPNSAGSKGPTAESFIDKLCHAQEHLIEVHSVALTTAPVAVVHSISSLLNSVVMLLSAADHVKGKSLAQPGFASRFNGMWPCRLCPSHIPANNPRNGENSCTSPRTQSNPG